ncbi:MAG TPA: hypothetical protein VJR26_03345 [Candidatus Acidoferrales bacterium]|nr:hypothetical protein [Candidatus Acidoferrales bacterium]
MAQMFLVFDFGTNEELAQQARHKFDGWKQAFRLGEKAVLKFDRGDAEAEPENPDQRASGEGKRAGSRKGASGAAARKGAKKKSADEQEASEAAETGPVRILIRLSFSDHEKLSQQRWVDRIPSEEPFKSAKGETVRHSDGSFTTTADLFDSLE